MDELQILVDALASAIARPVDVDDRHFRVLSYSSHTEGVDRVRLASILQREAPAEVTSWLESLGVREAERHVRVPANPTFGMAARVCFPIHFDGALLGYLWLIDEPIPLSPAELDHSLACVEELATVLFRLQRIDRNDRQRERDLLAQLLSAEPVQSANAGAALLQAGLLTPAPAHIVIVAQAAQQAGEAVPDAIRVRVAAAAERVRRTRGAHDLLVLISDEQVVLVLAVMRDGEEDACARDLLSEITSNLAATPEWSPLVGVGGTRANVTELRESHQEAQRAIWVARRVPALGPLLHWQSAGAYQLLVQLLERRTEPIMLGRAFKHLLENPDVQMLITTAESYLDHAGDARAAARELCLHRSSLYDRLRRIERVAGVDLSSGEGRLELHLAIRLWRLAAART